MLTLLGSLLGFLSSTFPEFLKLFRDSQDRKHELAILDRQMEQQRLGHTQRLEEIQIAADIAESQALYSYANHPMGTPWVEALQASVRPVITYAFFLVFAVVKVSTLVIALQIDGITLTAALQASWDEETQALFAAVMSFWFGSRQISKMRRGG
ncbi:MAG: hypothetical protein ACD_23C00871G0003 [uncultured bacterium]|nr:MAG: hypothetical protein ACD_23C00871G0003 [uncultured bacterium]